MSRPARGGGGSDRDPGAAVVRLLARLGEARVTLPHDFAERVLARVAALPPHGAWTPPVSLAQFAWAAGIGLAVLGFGTVALLGAHGMGAGPQVGPVAEELGRTAGAARSLAGGLLGVALRTALAVAARLPGLRGFADQALGAAGPVSLVVCLVVVVLATIVVTKDVRTRRVTP